MGLRREGKDLIGTPGATFSLQLSIWNELLEEVIETGTITDLKDASTSKWIGNVETDTS